MDISTSDESMQIITVSAGGKEILDRLLPQFGAYKYYKIGNIAIKLVPASTLPVDPTGLSYGADEGSTMTVDPRDQLTPGMMRITNGEDIFEDITGLSDAQQHGIYNNMLLDPRWYKWMLQSGVKRHATPRYWQIGQLHQDKWPGSVINVPDWAGSDMSVYGINGTSSIHMRDTSSSSIPTTGNVSAMVDHLSSSPYGLFQVGHRGVLGWLPTDGLQKVATASSYGNYQDKPLIASPPEVEVMKIILPKAYKTKYYYRMFVTETVYFKEPIVNFGVTDGLGSYYRPLDVFHYPGAITPVTPDVGSGGSSMLDSKTGGNYGNN